MDGPKEVETSKDVGHMYTPSQQTFGPLPHWIKRDRSSSGYKGVFKDKNRGGWRVKSYGSKHHWQVRHRGTGRRSLLVVHVIGQEERMSPLV